MHARRFYDKRPRWAIVNITNNPIEEIATEILAVRGPSRKREPSTNGESLF